QGANASAALMKEIGIDQLPANERYFGLHNFGNTCYCNSVLQALFFCPPFREKVLQYRSQKSGKNGWNGKKDSLLACLCDLFHNISSQKKKCGVLHPKKFIARLRKEYESFDNYAQHDAHELFNHLINSIHIVLIKKDGKSVKRTQAKKSSDTTPVENSSSPVTPSGYSEDEVDDEATWIHEIFQGTYTTITRCLTCETVKNKDEDFLDLSVDIEQNTSISNCLRVFSNQQTLGGEHKYSCEVCRSKQEAQIEMRIKKLPTILALHLKRFKYCETLNKYTKLTYRVVFPFELRLLNTTEDADNPERLYDLMAVVVHCGSGPYRGHYVSIVKSHGMWLLFDDDNVEKLDPSGMEDFYGVTADKNSESGYILFYQS
uniref:ubiquitinyl hydrolase 1 n=1 Tax=Ciona savignyi TaxID=51511 RepID=H2Z1Y3_CIOSA